MKLISYIFHYLPNIRAVFLETSIFKIMQFHVLLLNSKQPDSAIEIVDNRMIAWLIKALREDRVVDLVSLS
jgi:hypothetical protein